MEMKRFELRDWWRHFSDAFNAIDFRNMYDICARVLANCIDPRGFTGDAVWKHSRVLSSARFMTEVIGLMKKRIRK